MTFIFNNMNSTKTLVLYLKKIANKTKHKNVYELIPTKVNATSVGLSKNKDKVIYEFMHPYTKEKTTGKLSTMLW